MAYVFESFVLNFLRRERPDLRARRENIAWKVDTESHASCALLPIMQTDVSMDCGGQHIILDTKFYEDTLAEHRGGKKFLSLCKYNFGVAMPEKNATARREDPCSVTLLHRSDEESERHSSRRA
jgi:hypothetical protein